MKYVSLFAASLVVSLAAARPLQAAPVEKPVAPIQTGSGQVAGMVLASGVKAWDPLESTCRHASLSIL